MADSQDVLFYESGRLLAREEVVSEVQQQLKAAPEDAVLRFIIKPLAIAEEASRIIDKLSGAAGYNECNGSVGEVLRAEPM